VRADLPPALEQVVLRALHKDPSLRFQAAREFSAMLTAVAQSLPQASFVRLSNAGQSAAQTPEVATAPAFARTHTETSGRSRLRWLGAAAALGITLAALTALVVVFSRSRTREKDAGVDTRGSHERPATSRARSRRTPATKVDPAHFDLDAHFDVALDVARTHFSDAELVGFAAVPVRADGTVDLSRRSAGVTWTFQSASAPSKPLAAGGPPMGRCAVTVSSIDGNLAASVPILHACGQKSVPLPLCSVRRVVERASLGVAPKRISVAYLGFGKQPTWNVHVDGRQVMIPDDC
jgi:hypothetical protein